MGHKYFRIDVATQKSFDQTRDIEKAMRWTRDAGCWVEVNAGRCIGTLHADGAIVWEPLN